MKISCGSVLFSSFIILSILPSLAIDVPSANPYPETAFSTQCILADGPIVVGTVEDIVRDFAQPSRGAVKLKVTQQLRGPQLPDLITVPFAYTRSHSDLPLNWWQTGDPGKSKHVVVFLDKSVDKGLSTLGVLDLDASDKDWIGVIRKMIGFEDYQLNKDYLLRGLKQDNQIIVKQLICDLLLRRFDAKSGAGPAILATLQQFMSDKGISPERRAWAARELYHLYFFSIIQSRDDLHGPAAEALIQALANPHQEVRLEVLRRLCDVYEARSDSPYRPKLAAMPLDWQKILHQLDLDAKSTDPLVVRRCNIVTQAIKSETGPSVLH